MRRIGERTLNAKVTAAIVLSCRSYYSGDRKPRPVIWAGKSKAGILDEKSVGRANFCLPMTGV